jgi:hypothetical protein
MSFGSKIIYPKGDDIQQIRAPNLVGVRNAMNRFDFVREFSLKSQRARTTSFFVQVWTWRQWGQVNFGVLTLAAAQSCSSMVWPVGVSFAVEGHRTSSRLMTGPFLSFRGEAVAKNFILILFYASR